jgi:cell division septation protein DedD
VCAAADIPVEMYYRWKAKYRGLTPAKVRDRRRREQIVRRATAVSFAAAVVVTIGAPCAFLVARWTRGSASAVPDVAASVAAPAASVAPPAAVVVPPAPTSAPSAQPVSQADQSSGHVVAQDPPVQVAPLAQEVGADDVDVSRSSGFAVQIAALPDLQEARRSVERLTAAGYPAFLSPTSVGQVSLYRVRVGPLKTRRLAEDVAGRLEHEGYPTPWITK